MCVVHGTLSPDYATTYSINQQRRHTRKHMKIKVRLSSATRVYADN